MLLDNLVHELNTLRGVLGEPDWLEYADLSARSVTVCFRFGGCGSHSWVDLPGMARYKQEFAFYAPRPPRDPDVALAVPAQRAERAGDRGRRAGLGPVLADGRDRLLRGGVQARAGRVPRARSAAAAPARPTARTGCTTSRCARRSRLPPPAASELAGAQDSGARARRDGGARQGTITVANAPCSYGAFEITVGIDPNVPEAVELLRKSQRPDTPASTSGPSGTWATPRSCPGGCVTGSSLGRRLLSSRVRRARRARARAAGRSTPCSTRSMPRGRRRGASEADDRRRGIVACALSGPGRGRPEPRLGRTTPAGGGSRRCWTGSSSAPRAGVRADVPSSHRHVCRGSVGDRPDARADRRRRLPRHGPSLLGGGDPVQAVTRGGTGSTTST